MLSHVRSFLDLLYFVRWLRLRSPGDLEKARSTTPMTRHTNPIVNGIVIFSPSSSSPARRRIRSAVFAHCVPINSQTVAEFRGIRELLFQYQALVNQLMINIDRALLSNGLLIQVPQTC